jgi:regulatory protein
VEITRIESQKRSPDRLNLHVDGEFRLSLAAELVFAAGLRVGDPLTEATRNALERGDHAWKAKEAALRLLAIRPRSAAELTRRLREKQYPEAVVHDCVDRLLEAGLVQDAEFAGMFVRDRVRLRPQGRRRLVQELRNRGIDEETARAAIDDGFESEQVSELELARQAARKWRPRAGEAAARGRQRLYGLLARRGFAMDVIREVVDEFAPPGDEPA